MGVKAESTFALKDHLFNASTVGQLADALRKASPKFSKQAFCNRVLERFPELELKQRIDWMVEVLGDLLPERFPAAVKVLHKALPPPLDPNLTDDDFGEFIWGVPGEYVARYGCQAKHLDLSLDFLHAATQRFTSENAIRPFLAEFPDETLSRVRAWSRDENYHVRRLASEGIRPYLPWAQQVRLPAETVIEILDGLHADPTRYVTRSVANTLNDLSRDHPEQVLSTLADWQRRGVQNTDELNWMTRHAARTLMKQDHPDVLELFGYPAKPKLRLRDVSAPEAVHIGDDWSFSGVVHSQAQQRLMINLKIGFLKSNGRHSVKVYKVADADLGRGERLALKKKVTFRPVTTRTLYPGTHHAELVINGRTRWEQGFELLDT